MLFAAACRIYGALIGSDVNLTPATKSYIANQELHSYLTQAYQQFGSFTGLMLSPNMLPEVVSGLLKTPELAFATSSANQTITTTPLDSINGIASHYFLTAGLRAYIFDAGNGDTTV